MRKRNKKMRILVIIICVIMVVALVLTYVMMFPLNAYAGGAPETPPPPDYGTSGDYDESTLTFPGDEDEEEEAPEPMLMITGGPITLDIGQSFAIPYIMNDFPPGTMPEWESKNPQVAMVTSDGILKAMSPGNAEIAVRAGQKRASVLVTVNELKAAHIIIVVDETIRKTGPNSYEMTVGDVTRFTARVEPEGAKVEKIAWVLGNGNVASLSQNGEFVAEAIGQTQVTLTAGPLVDAVTISITESGVPLTTIWDYLKYGVIVIVIIVVIIILLNVLVQKKKKEKARQRAIMAKRRKEEAERRAREEAAYYDMRREAPEPRPAAKAGERSTMKVTGTAVGAGITPTEDKQTELERPLTLDDLE